MTQLLTLIETIRRRLEAREYTSEAMISHGIVTPIVGALGWDCADPLQFVPEFSLPGGRVDFALLGLGRKPAIFIEVKAVGRAVEGDKQLFSYAFHNGVPLCVLTDGREWSFYLPSGHGSYEDRRVYRLQLDDRSPEECARVFERYLSRDRVRDGSAFEAAQRDHRDAAGKREAANALPRAWHDLIQTSDELLVEHLGDKAEALCGFKPSASDTLAFLRALRTQHSTSARDYPTPAPEVASRAEVKSTSSAPPSERTITYQVFGEARTAPNAAQALVDVLMSIARRDPTRIGALADAVRTPRRSHIARTAAEINPGRPDLTRAQEFSPGWLVGVHIANREKMGIIRTAISIFEITPDDIEIVMPNAP